MLDFLQGEKMDILVAGDSMMRQLFIRLVHMMRGTRRVLVGLRPILGDRACGKGLSAFVGRLDCGAAGCGGGAPAQA